MANTLLSVKAGHVIELAARQKVSAARTCPAVIAADGIRLRDFERFSRPLGTDRLHVRIILIRNLAGLPVEASSM